MYDVVYRAQARPSIAVHLIVGRAMQRNVRRALQRGCGVALAARQPSGGALRSAVPASSQRGSSYNYNARLPSQPTPGARCPARHVETRASVCLVAVDREERKVAKTERKEADGSCGSDGSPDLLALIQRRREGSAVIRMVVRGPASDAT
ncbi:hypothetical protein POSPLADRAFT_1036666 [Postia placenta MAD-698-R-SB12]|uniref:Uncharacterized protein n=1 Tax=Postia placenta MAD-698-R-SB12 TaxID=670580 RepID=A0A1X6MMM7_9APHY|nr:hypothetical protein POSPLADRAFT_1036666 [Postia placenta MAD-698-R-SB12]OSX57578.1 hypothetical protein POSPLADRAFT_1036666 [Postia placenta MAD-698-R-SB12]